MYSLHFSNNIFQILIILIIFSQFFMYQSQVMRWCLLYDKQTTTPIAEKTRKDPLYILHMLFVHHLTVLNI